MADPVCPICDDRGWVQGETCAVNCECVFNTSEGKHLTDWEVGNHILTRICDEMTEFAHEITQPPNNRKMIARDLQRLRNHLNKKYAVPLMGAKAIS